ncbi:MAG TPA: hypothetical protein GXZ23_02715 [Clostridiales bacterium]|nr:hypothetical protein [Clostridiales bacterium]
MDTIKISRGNTKIIAHRGLSGIELENTCSAFVAAGNRSYFGIETDVHITSDGKFVIFHDDTTGRLAGDNMTVEETSMETLQNLILFDKDGTKIRRDLRMPTLVDYIKICKKYDKIAVLELKNRFQAAEIYEIAEIIKEFDYLDNTIFISFELDNLIDLRAKYPNTTAQYLVDDYSHDLIEILKANKLDLDIKYTSLTKDIIENLHYNGIKVNCWTCDDKKAAEDLVAWGIDYITSNILE